MSHEPLPGRDVLPSGDVLLQLSGSEFCFVFKCRASACIN